ncbi:hypothetical protein ACTPD5_22520, partial [Clostridioides difficile]|uniref:hypothetical protein n=1 Tax=Clostridioides difficile TaxID=1496 RepID=UPI003F8D57C0
KLKIKNRIATEIYKNLGFGYDIQDMHYNDLDIETNTFENILIPTPFIVSTGIALILIFL